ncbi:MAG: glycosyltransferase family 39 protein [Chloroflexi bacterium]|nr:glycosyltransferase family 39 protein [Chloroflexota bacterium]
MIPYWIADTLKGLPIFLVTLLGIGVPWAYVLLPQSERRDRPTLLALALAVGAALMTAWMFVLGTIGASTGTSLLRWEGIALGTALLAALPLALLILRRRSSSEPQSLTTAESGKPTLDERWLLFLIALAFIVAVIVIMFWPFTAFDALWVYGYEARLYALTGHIPNTIDYYPQFLPLLYALGQIDGVNDHTARAVVPLLHLGAILASYVLGRMIDGRRAGVYLAALWALFPHVGEWSRAGDLEIPLTFSLTLSAAFFLKAWNDAGPAGVKRNQRTALRYAAIGGAMFGVALWTKPTAGAFALGVGLMMAVEVFRVASQGARTARSLWLGIRPRLEVAAVTALACAPLGGVWYVRNLLLGHNAVDFPPGYWQTLAERGGDDLGFPLLAALVWAICLWGRDGASRRAGLIVGVLLMVGAAARSMFLPDLSLEARRLTLIELAAFVAGAGLFLRSMVGFLRGTESGRALLPLAARIGWAQVLALPYFVVWFYAYSYHYRLLFAVVPLLLLPVAVLAARWVQDVWLRHGALRPVVLAALTALAVSGIISPVPDKFAGTDYLFTDALPDDDARYRSGNAALMNIVDGLRVWETDHPDDRLVVSAPGVDRLPFFFPLADIRVENAPTRLSDLAHAAYFIYGLPETRGEYENVPFFRNQVVNALGRQDIVRRAWGLDDGIFKYDVFELNLNQRWVRPEPLGLAIEDVVFGDFARFIGYDLGGLELWEGRRIIAHLVFEVIAPPPDDYSIFLHLRDADGDLIANWDGPTARTDRGYYSTLLWEPGEFITDERSLSLPDGVAPLGEGYRLVIGFYEAETNERLPVTVNGQTSGDDYVIDSRMAIVPPRQ